MGEETEKVTEREELYKVLPAISCFFDKLREAMPDAEAVAICNCDIKNEIVHALEASCGKIGGRTVRLHGIDKLNGHPTALGMIQIKDQVLNALTGEGR